MSGGAVVVGGGLAALEIALALSRERPRMRVTVISRETVVPYRPWLIHLPAGGSPPPMIPFARLLDSAGVHVIRASAAAADIDRRRVDLDSGGSVEYEQLVVATGAAADRERVPGAHGNALFPCDLADVQEFAARISEGKRVVVVFGWERPGPGIEYAAWIARYRHGVQLTAIDGDGTLRRRFGEKATARLKELFEARGARLVTSQAVERIGRGIVELHGGETVAADVIGVAAPLRGITDWLPRDLVDLVGRLRVDSAMAAVPGVYGIGDVVAVPDGYRLSPTLFSIRATARGVARNVTGTIRGATPSAVLKPGQPDMMGPDLAGTALLVRDRRLVLSGRLPLLLGSIMQRRYLRSRSARLNESRNTKKVTVPDHS
jgi:NADH:ubiquinone reductase (H+-translocating)